LNYAFLVYVDYLYGSDVTPIRVAKHGH